MTSALNDDVWIAVLRLCDVYTVLQVSLTSRALYCTALCKTVWLSILGDLSSRGLVDALPMMESNIRSSGDIIGHIKRTVCGSLPHVNPRTTLRIPPLRLQDLSATCGPVKLLPGGRYLAVVGPHRFDCLHVESGRRVWSLLGAVRDFAVDMLGQGHSVRLAIVLRRLNESFPRIQVVEVHLRTGYSRARIDLPSQQLSAEIEQLSNVNLNGSFLSTSFNLHHRAFVLLVNWRKDEHLLFDCAFSPQHRSMPTLFTISGHVLLASTSPAGAPILIQWSLKSFKYFWRWNTHLSVARRHAISLGSTGEMAPEPTYVHDLHRGVLWDFPVARHDADSDSSTDRRVQLHVQLLRDCLRRSRARLVVHLSGDIVLLSESTSGSATDPPHNQKRIAGIVSRLRSRLRSSTSSPDELPEPTGLLLRYTISCWPERFDVFSVAATPTYLAPSRGAQVQDVSYAGYTTSSEDGSVYMLESESRANSSSTPVVSEPCLWRHLAPSGALATLVDSSTVVIA
ncbi:hypothetical protein C8F01DRAFT_1373490 [Mycena amicta]|nr:hypothetical protein C8F01DRAFT_1373490 [Mycena amicta]